MKISKLITVLKKSLGEARWSRYDKFSDKVEVFKILFRLRFYTEISIRQEEIATQRIFDYTVTGPSYSEILYLFREIFLDFQYQVSFKNESPTIIDGGANIGMAILFFKKFHPSCKIIAFEPNPRVFKFLRQNVTSNKLKDVEIINSGLGGQDGNIDFYVDNNNSLISSVDQNRGGKEVTKVKIIRLSTFLVNRTFDFAKIDIEGAEWGVVNDLNDTRTIQNINQYIFEYHHNLKPPTYQLSDFLKIFEQNGFGYNLNASFRSQGEFQDIAINFFTAK